MRKYIRDAKISYIQLEQETQLQNHTSILWQPPLLAQPAFANILFIFLVIFFIMICSQMVLIFQSFFLVNAKYMGIVFGNVNLYQMMVVSFCQLGSILFQLTLLTKFETSSPQIVLNSTQSNSFISE